MTATVHFRWGFWWLVRIFTLTASGISVMPLLPLLPGEQKLGRWGKTIKIWTQSYFTGAISLRPEWPLCAQVQLRQVIPRTQTEQMEYSLAAERRRMRLIHAEIITDLLSSSTAQLGTVGAWARRLHCWKCDWWKLRVLVLPIRRVPEVWGRCASRADAGGERGARATATRQPSSQHLWRPDHGLDGECGYNCSKVWAHLFFFQHLSLNWLQITSLGFWGMWVFCVLAELVCYFSLAYKQHKNTYISAFEAFLCIFWVFQSCLPSHFWPDLRSLVYMACKFGSMVDHIIVALRGFCFFF